MYYTQELTFSPEWNLYAEPVKAHGTKWHWDRRGQSVTARFCKRVACILAHEAQRMELLTSRFNYHVDGSPIHNEQEEKREIAKLKAQADYYYERAERLGY